MWVRERIEGRRERTRERETGHLCDLADHEVSELAPAFSGADRERKHEEEEREDCTLD